MFKITTQIQTNESTECQHFHPLRLFTPEFLEMIPQRQKCQKNKVHSSCRSFVLCCLSGQTFPLWQISTQFLTSHSETKHKWVLESWPRTVESLTKHSWGFHINLTPAEAIFFCSKNFNYEVNKETRGWWILAKHQSNRFSLTFFLQRSLWRALTEILLQCLTVKMDLKV